MNCLVQLKGRFDSKPRDGRPGPSNIPNGAALPSEKLRIFSTQLRRILSFWMNDSLGISPLVRVSYIAVVAKSNRIARFLLEKGSRSINSQIVGAEFSKGSNPYHIITYKTSLSAIESTIDDIEALADIIDSEFDGCVTSDAVRLINEGKKALHTKRYSKSTFTRLVKDSYYADGFSIKDFGEPSIDEIRLVSIYDVGLPYDDVISRIGFGFHPVDRLDDYSWLLTPEQYRILYNRAPYLISMSLPDLNDFVRPEPGIPLRMGYTIPDPGNEPVIGVIDTLFSEDVYFSKWVESHCLIDDSLIEDDDYIHGTEVASIIVDGPTLNPALDDGCGRFRVRHFGVAKHGRMSSVDIMRKIEQIILENKDIKVWNLSIGSVLPIPENCISPEASVLDRLQYENDVIFVIAGTNSSDGDFLPIGAPADSLNSITVNSIEFNGRPAVYSRKGPVLRFFNKPDVSAWGGSSQDRMQVYGPRGPEKCFGTSFSAPWIARKLAYLIHVMNLSREAAKALLIDSAAGWNTDSRMRTIIGYGAVPIKIRDVINCRSDEIRFFINGTVLDYETYTSTIPLPSTRSGFPYRFRVTLCYSPRCSRNQGVDYTDTELDVHFGRYRNGRIHTINNDKQGEPVYIDLPEGKARSDFRKWDNVKHINEGLGKRASFKRKQNESDIFWGISIRSVERLDDKPGRGLPFSAVVTMKATDGVDRFSQFIKLCNTTHFWSAVPVDQNAMVETYNEAQTILEFDE